MEAWFDPRSPGYHADPYPTYARLQREAPVYRHENLWGTFWFVSRYLDVVGVLRDPRFTAEKLTDEAFAFVRAQNDPALIHLFEMVSRMMLVRDPPDHTRLRNLVSRAFTPRVVEQLRPRVEAIATELADEARERGTFDVIADFAAPLPIIVIAELLGAPVADRPLFKDWSDRLAVFIDGSLRDQGMAEAAKASIELRDYLAEQIRQRRRQPREDLLTRLVEASVEADALRADALSEDEVIATTALILAAGHETTTNLIGNAVLALVEHPVQYARLRAEPELVPTAVEEVLRFDGPVQHTSRVPTEPVTIGGCTIEAGQEVNVLIGAANRDPLQFPDPDHFDVARRENRHLAFGHGAHFCLGAALARLEGEIALRTLCALPPLEPAGDWPRRPGIVLRGLAEMPVFFSR